MVMCCKYMQNTRYSFKRKTLEALLDM